MTCQHLPSDAELARAIQVLQAQEGLKVHGPSLDRVVLMLGNELDSRKRTRRLIEIMESRGDDCTIGQARVILEAEGY